MKKKNKSFLLIALIIVLVLMILSLLLLKYFYKPKEKNTNEINNNNIALYGVWVKTRQDDYKDNNLANSISSLPVYYININEDFMSNCIISKESDDYCENHKYSFKENNILLMYNYDGKTITYEYSLSEDNNKLTLREDIDNNYYMIHYFERAKG